MGITTEIAYADSTLNLMAGCDGCELWNPKSGIKTCYAGIMHTRYAGLNSGWPKSFDRPTLFLHRLRDALRWRDLRGTDRPDKPWLNGMPRVIFLNDLGDAFTESLPIDWLAQPWPVCPHGHSVPVVQFIEAEGKCVCTRCSTQWTPVRVLDVIASSPHVYLLLTKRALRMRTFFETHPCPGNMWPGVTIPSQAAIPRLKQLTAIDAKVRWISAEPLLGRLAIEDFGGVNLVVAGGESGPGARAVHPRWVRDLRDQCHEAHVSFFMKQWGEWAPSGDVSAQQKYVCGCGESFVAGEEHSQLEKHTVGPDACPLFREAQVVYRVGKKNSGRMLDNREWLEMPNTD